MVMDADNLIYPSCLRKLADALHDHPDVDAAYAILEDFGEQRNIRSALAWDVDRLCRANYIDAQSMFRKSTWERLGGYRADDEHRLRLGGLGPVAAARRRRRPGDAGHRRSSAATGCRRGSMIALTNLATDDAIAAMRKRHPTLPWPVARDTCDRAVDQPGARRRRSRRRQLRPPAAPVDLRQRHIAGVVPR